MKRTQTKTKPYPVNASKRPAAGKTRGKSPRVETPQRTSPVLRFSPTAWAKLLFFRDRGETEIGGFGVCADEDKLRVEQFVPVKQEATTVSVRFDDQAVADFFEGQVDRGRRPEQFGRIWLHTHPGASPAPTAIRSGAPASFGSQVN